MVLYGVLSVGAAFLVSMAGGTITQARTSFCCSFVFLFVCLLGFVVFWGDGPPELEYPPSCYIYFPHLSVVSLIRNDGRLDSG